jgi:chromosome segregation ATPase
MTQSSILAVLLAVSPLAAQRPSAAPLPKSGEEMYAELRKSAEEAEAKWLELNHVLSSESEKLNACDPKARDLTLRVKIAAEARVAAWNRYYERWQEMLTDQTKSDARFRDDLAKSEINGELEQTSAELAELERKKKDLTTGRAGAPGPETVYLDKLIDNVKERLETWRRAQGEVESTTRGIEERKKHIDTVLEYVAGYRKSIRTQAHYLDLYYSARLARLRLSCSTGPF